VKRGFTLIELLVVIAIIGILAGIVLAALGASRQAANVAKARAEIKEIQKAAEIVFSEYGYYPNDSHGSITCPKNLIIDQTTGRTWGDFTSACLDPWGNPYEWDNACAGGATRMPHPPYDPSCASFSDQSQGAYGITMDGPDGVNNGCTGDDICSGSNGHAIYGWPVNGPGPMCTTTSAVNCSALTVGQCSSQAGCSVASANCSGTYACSQWNGTNSATCTTGHSGCTWNNPQSKCNGSSQSCSAFAQSSCTPSGCSWITASCTGTSADCSAFSAQNTCNAQQGCNWQ
jgi:general secretion pathway protein G